MSMASWRAVRTRILDARFSSAAGGCSPSKTATRGCTSGLTPSAHPQEYLRQDWGAMFPLFVSYARPSEHRRMHFCSPLVTMAGYWAA